MLIKLISAAAIGLTAMTVSASAVVVDALGDRDFLDGEAPGGVAGFEGAAAGDPPGFNEFRGSDFGGFATFRFTHVFAPVAGPATAFLTLGIFDHDSTTIAAPGLSITFDGVVQDVSVWAGISALPAFQYIRDMAVDDALLADGMLEVVITSTAVPGQSGNGLGIDFSELNVDAPAVPLPATGLLLIGGLGLMAAARKRAKR